MAWVCNTTGLRPARSLGACVGHVVGAKELGLAVHRRLHVVADGTAPSRPTLPRPALRSWGREVGRAARFSLGLQSGIAELTLLERLKRRLAMVGASTARGPRILLGSLAVQGLELTRAALVKRRQECGELVGG